MQMKANLTQDSHRAQGGIMEMSSSSFAFYVTFYFYGELASF